MLATWKETGKAIVITIVIRTQTKQQMKKNARCTEGERKGKKDGHRETQRKLVNMKSAQKERVQHQSSDNRPPSKTKRKMELPVIYKKNEGHDASGRYVETVRIRRLIIKRQHQQKK